MGNTNSRMLDSNTIKLMKRAGCIKIAFGVESGSAEILKDMRKNNDLLQLKGLVKTCYDNGVGVYFNMSTNTFNASFTSVLFTNSSILYGVIDSVAILFL